MSKLYKPVHISWEDWSMISYVRQEELSSSFLSGLTGHGFTKLLEDNVNALCSLYISDLMASADDEATMLELSKRTDPVVLRVSVDDTYVVYCVDDVFDTFDTEPLWDRDKDNLIKACKRWYGDSVVILFDGE